MKTKNYSKNLSLGGKNIFILLFFVSLSIQSQVRVNFTPREPISSPSTSIFSIKGDFTLIGNTNLTLNNYDVNEPNSNNNMVYVDIDGDSNTFNSSSANLTFSNENGAIPECSKVIFAGLYWTGRASDGSNSPETFNVTKNSVTKLFNKRKVKLKGPSSTSYIEITANSNDIYYPQNSDGFMYSAFAEITDYVKNNGIGQYTVADIALVEGNGGSTGYYGGWGIIVVYENSKMKWRDITVFDGHAYVQGNSTSNHQIPISGFNAVQTGQVNVKLGLMAGEGDRSISGDYFNIQRSSDNNWQSLNHTGNSTNNFFNSSIQTGGNTRNPNLVNNTGLDISMFNIPNPNNSVITNNQTSTTLRYGSTQDTYVIFMAAMAVDAYIPDPEGVMSLVTINGVPAASTTTVTPGQEIEYSIKILNEGTENINNAQIKIQLPYTATFVNGSQNGVVNFSPLPTPNNIYFNPNDGPSGTLIWDIGTLPVPVSPTTILGELKYKIKITEDCFLLKNSNCVPAASLFGYINGIGAITGIQIINKPFIQGYVTSGLCIGDPILNPITTMIDATNFINQNCQNTINELVFNYCSPISQVPFNSIASNYPIGTQFYNNYPVNGSTIEYTNSNPFPNTLGSLNYYAVPPNANGCYYTLKINIDTNPTITSPQSVNINGCNSSVISPLVYSETPVNINLQDFINAGGNVSNNQLNYTISYVDTSNGSCPLVVTRTYTIITSCSTQTITQTFTIIDTTNPVILVQASNAEVQCDGNGNTEALNAWLASNGGASASDNCSNVTWTNNFTSVSDTCGATGSASVTFTATDNCGNSAATTATFTIIDTTNPVFTSELPQNISVSCDAVPNPVIMTGTDNCSDVTINVLDAIDRQESQCEGEYIINRTWTITDGCNNSSSYTQIITVFDNTPPTLTNQLNSQISVLCSEIPEVPELIFTDNCSGINEINYSETSNVVSIYEYVLIREWIVSDNCGNEANFSQTINVSVEKTSDAIPFAICIEENPIDLFTILDDSIPTTGEWQEITNSGGLNGNIFNPNNVTLGNYTIQYVVALEDNSCPMIYEIYLNVNDDCIVLAACDITVYNAVSPNDDSSNDFLFIDGIECYPNNSIEIYNRWGILVYEETGYNNSLKSFKGVSEGRNTVNRNELLPDGTYFYILKYTDEENKKHDRSGYLYLNR
ncbi:MAG: gliding motility-associated C-terminal domain-containing protein [Flavobacterium sp.]|nr:MAG: gliding motility-associated C-terminal domain-containing protein [Flavobacterium sp.]